MSSNEKKPTTRATLGLGGLTINAMALIAPGAFLWLTFFIQSSYGQPMAAQGMWFGIFAALLLCLATAIAYAELSKLYPGAGSSYFFAEQAFLSKTHAYRFARIAKFIVGWASHLYYWVYPGLMVGVTALVVGYMVGSIWPDTFNATVPSPLFMIIFCPLFAIAVAYICFRGVTGTTAVNTAINVIQISALIVFSVMAVGYRMNHTQGSVGITLDPNGAPITKVIATDKDGKPVKDAQGNFVIAKTPDGKEQDFTVDYSMPVQKGPSPDDPKVMVDQFQYHSSAASVLAPHNFNYMFIQACIAILILVGFESVTSMGEEAKDPKRHIPKAVILSLLIQGLVCYLIEYFAANYFMHNGYQTSNALGSAAPIGDMMIIVGTWLFGSAAAGKAFMLVQAFTVFLALVGTTLSCMSTGARVTYAMGRDEEVPEHFGMLHGEKLTPHRAIWTLAILSAVIGILTILFNFAGPGAQADDTIKALPHNFWYSFGLWSHDLAAKLPQSSVVITLVSNFGTFLLYMMTCVVAIVAFREHHTFSGFKHMFIPLFGVAANLMCMLFYLIGPFMVTGMSWHEPYVALAICAVWGIYGLVYFKSSSSRKGREIYVTMAPKVKV
ncbi:MAG TPA: APC family permease [Terriglobia bacterium]|nr:APC family permease [Terriglobia bacterium]